MKLPRATSIYWLLATLLGLVAAALLQYRWHANRPVGPADGGFWTVLEADGPMKPAKPMKRVKWVARGAGRLRMSEGDELALVDGEFPRFAEEVRIVANAPGPATLELDAHHGEGGDGGEGGDTVLRFTVGGPVRAQLAQPSGGAVLPLPVAEDAVDPLGPFTVTLAWRKGRISALLDGTELFGQDSERLPAMKDVRLRVAAGRLELLSLVAATHERPVPGAQPQVAEETFRRIGPGRFADEVAGLCAGMVALLGGLFGFFHLLRRAGDTPGDALRDALRCTGLAGIVLFVALLFDLALRPILVAPAVALGLVPALLARARAARAARAGDGGDAATAGPLARLALFGLALFLLLGAGVWRSAALASRTARALDRKAAPEPFTAERRLTLDAGSALVVPGELRDLTLSARVAFGPASALAVRLRAKDADRAEGMAFVTGSDPRLGTRFYRELGGRFQPVSKDNWTMPHAPEYALEIRAEGDRYEAWLDGKPVAACTDRAFDRGNVVLVAARGAVDLMDLRVVPGPDVVEASALGPLRPFAGLAAAAAASVLLWIAAASWLARLALPRAVLAFVFAASPIGVAFLLQDGMGPATAVTRDLLIAGGGVLLAAVAWLRPARAAAVLVLPLLAFSCAATALCAAHALEPQRPGAPRLVDWDGRRLDDDLLYLQHPAFRAGNPYLARHQFRGREVAARKPDGTLRVAVLGSRGAYGLGFADASTAPFPAQLAAALDAEAGAGRVEVLNAAWPGARLVALHRFLRDVVLGFAPDVVVLCVPADASREFSSLDTPDYLAWIADPRTHATLTDRLRDEERWITRTDLDAGHVAEACARVIEEVARLCAAADCGLVLCREPVRDDDVFCNVAALDVAIGRASNRSGVAVADLQKALPAERLDACFLDPAHLSADGHRRVAESLLPVVRRVLGPGGKDEAE